MATATKKDEIVLNPQDNLGDVLSQWQEQAEKLKPYVEAYEQYTTLIENFTAIKDGKVPPSARATAPVRRTSTVNGDRAARGDRPAQMLSVIQQAGDRGVTVKEAADAMGMEANYLYRITATLEKNGEIVKRNRKLFIATDADKAEAKSDEDAGSEAEGTDES